MRLLNRCILFSVIKSEITMNIFQKTAMKQMTGALKRCEKPIISSFSPVCSPSPAATALRVQRARRGPVGAAEVRVVRDRLRRVLPGQRPLLLLGRTDLLQILPHQQEVLLRDSNSFSCHTTFLEHTGQHLCVNLQSHVCSNRTVSHVSGWVESFQHYLKYHHIYT